MGVFPFETKSGRYGIVTESEDQTARFLEEFEQVLVKITKAQAEFRGTMDALGTSIDDQAVNLEEVLALAREKEACLGEEKSLTIEMQENLKALTDLLEKKPEGWQALARLLDEKLAEVAGKKEELSQREASLTQRLQTLIECRDGLEEAKEALKGKAREARSQIDSLEESGTFQLGKELAGE